MVELRKGGHEWHSYFYDVKVFPQYVVNKRPRVKSMLFVVSMRLDKLKASSYKRGWYIKVHRDYKSRSYPNHNIWPCRCEPLHQIVTVTSKAVLHVACRGSNKDDDDTENILVCFVQDQNKTLGDPCWNPPECTGCDGTWCHWFMYVE